MDESTYQSDKFIGKKCAKKSIVVTSTAYPSTSVKMLFTASLQYEQQCEREIGEENVENRIGKCRKNGVIL
jgi:hypothetical protein